MGRSTRWAIRQGFLRKYEVSPFCHPLLQLLRLFRYLGGAPTFVLSEAVDTVRQAHLSPTTEYPPSSASPITGPTVDHLYFRPNVLYRPLSGLPTPEGLQYPPSILSDVLVQMYFSKIHHT
jgi:hypothetical protein